MRRWVGPVVCLGGWVCSVCRWVDPVVCVGGWVL